MKIVKFYRGEIKNSDNWSLEEMWKFSLGELEMDHSYIQYMFPSNEPSMMNGDSPTMTKEESHIFKNDPELQEKVKKSFLVILNFFGFELVSQDGLLSIIPLKSTIKRPKPQAWLEHFNHNMLRVTRILKCLRLTGLGQYAILFFHALIEYKDNLSENTLWHWKRAVSDDLWNYNISTIRNEIKLLHEEEVKLTETQKELHIKELRTLEWLKDRTFIFSEEIGAYGQREYTLSFNIDEKLKYIDQCFTVHLTIMGDSEDYMQNIVLYKEDFYYKLKTSNPEIFCELLTKITPKVKTDKINKVLKVYKLLKDFAV